MKDHLALLPKKHFVRLLVALCLLAQLPPITKSSAHSEPPAANAVVDANYVKLPLSFEANRGQADKQVRFLARTGGALLLLKSTEAVLTLTREEKIKTSPKNESRLAPGEPAVRRITSTIKMKLAGANPNPLIRGLEQMQAKSSYFTGSDPQQWTTGVPNYAKVKYESVYPGIDLIFYGNARQLEYDFVVAPGANPKQIRLSFAGARAKRLEANGDLILETNAGQVRQHRPIVYQEENGTRRQVAGAYVKLPSGQIGFAVGSYDATRPLVIDPGISYATYLGTYLNAAIAIDKDGNAYVASQLPATPGAFSGGNAYSVVKLNAGGTAVIYSATFGGEQDDRINDLTVDAAGNCYLTGRTKSSYFPTTPGAFQTTFGINGHNYYNAFVAKLNPAGSALVYSTFLRGNQFRSSESKLNFGEAITVDAQGHAYVTGWTNTFDFPTTPGAFQPAIHDNGISPPADTFLIKFNPAGSAPVYSTYIGSGSNDIPSDIAVDAAGNVFITGLTFNGRYRIDRPAVGTYPKTPGAFDNPVSEFASLIFVTKFNPAGTALVYSTILGAGSTSFPTTPRSFLSVSAANYTPLLAGEAIVAAFGSGLAITTQTAATTPLPLTLGGTVVRVRDSAGTEREAPLFFVSPTQINYLMPAGTANGAATVTVISGDDLRSAGTPQIGSVAPGLFTANASGQGVAAAVALRIKADNTQSFEPVARFDPAQNRLVAVPIDLGPEGEQVFLILYGTGIRFRSSLSNVSARIGGAEAPVTFAGAQEGFAGLDQINVRIPRSLIGRGEVEVALTVDGKNANPVRIAIR